MNSAFPPATPVNMESPLCVCGQSQTTARQTPARDEVTGEIFTYCECSACGTERVSPRPSLGAIGSYYPQDYYAYVPSTSQERSFAHSLGRLVYRVFFAPSAEVPMAWRMLRIPLRLMLRPLRYRTLLCFRQPAVRRVFEFGAATGKDLSEFRALGWEVTGCEPSSKACEVARMRGFELQNCTAEQATLPASYYTCILMNNVFEHLHDPAAVLAKCRGGLAAGGVLELIVPNHASLSARFVGPSWPGYDPPRHLWGFTPKSITALLRRSGFSVEHIHHQAPTLWSWVASVAGTRSPAGSTRFRRWAARFVPQLLLPVGVVAAVCRRGDFIRVVARKT
jgi:SAM-dependent methyltransferase